MRYHALYTQTIAHYKDQLRIPMLTVRYEDMVQRQEEETRRVLEYVGLDWHPDVLTFYESKRVVETASKHQVRKRIYNTSIGRHRHYPQARNSSKEEQAHSKLPVRRVHVGEQHSKTPQKVAVCTLIPESLVHDSLECLERGLCFWNIEDSELEFIVTQSVEQQLYQFPCQPSQSFGSHATLNPAVEMVRV